MSYFRTVAAMLGTAVALAGCAGPRPPAGHGHASPAGVQVAAAMPALGTSAFAVDPLRPGEPTGTFVGQKTLQLRRDLEQLQETLRRHSEQLQALRAGTVRDAEQYYGTTAAINARLQVGTTPGNPALLQQWNAAQAQLNQIDANIARMNDLANRLATDAALAGYLLEAIRAAYDIPGAVEADHRQLSILEGEVQQTAVVVDRLLAEVNADIARQRNYIAAERQSLNMLAQAITAGELYGEGIRSAGFAAPVPPRDGGAALPSAYTPDARRPLVIIRFDRPDLDYEQPLYTAISQALERRPEAVFDVVAITPLGGRGVTSGAAKRNAERVLRSLTEMGLPPDRVRLSAANSADTDIAEVHIYIR